MADERKNFTNPGMIQQLLSTFSQVYSEEDAAVIHDLVVEHLEAGPKIPQPQPWKHVAQHFDEIFPEIIADSRAEPVQQRLLEEYAKKPSTPETRLRDHPGDNSIGAAVVIGGAIGVVVAAAIVGYCLGGPDPGPGESVEVRC